VAQLNKVARNAGFMEEWLQKRSAETGRKTRLSRRKGNRRDLEFEYKRN
jgi:hypothetical protein